MAHYRKHTVDGFGSVTQSSFIWKLHLSSHWGVDEELTVCLAELVPALEGRVASYCAPSYFCWGLLLFSLFTSSLLPPSEAYFLFRRSHIVSLQWTSAANANWPPSAPGVWLCLWPLSLREASYCRSAPWAPKWPCSSAITFRFSLYCCSISTVFTFVLLCDSLWKTSSTGELWLFFHHVVLEIKPRLSVLVASIFTEPSFQPWKYLLYRPWCNTFYYIVDF